MLVEGSSMRSISRITGVSINTVTKLLVDAGSACEKFHDQRVRGVDSRRIQCDEIWSFCYAKARNVEASSSAPEGAGDIWTWTAIDSDSKLIISWLVSSGRDAEYANEFMMDVRGRIEGRIQLTTDGLKAYLLAVEGAFAGYIDYAQLVKVYGSRSLSSIPDRRYSPSKHLSIQKYHVSGDPDPAEINTSYVEKAQPDHENVPEAIHPADQWPSARR